MRRWMYQALKQSVKVCLIMALVMTVVLSVLLLCFARYCFRIFTDNPQVITYAIQIVSYFVPFYFLWTLIEVIANSLRGAGDALAPMVISVGGICGLRILWVLFVVPHWSNLLGISICYPISWVITVTLLFVHYKRGKWLKPAQAEQEGPQT